MLMSCRVSSPRKGHVNTASSKALSGLNPGVTIELSVSTPVPNLC